MIRKIIKIDEEKCNGCGACANACHEGAIAMVNGKAKLMREDYCDGLGDCLPSCPTGAITFEEREAAAYDAEAVAAAQAAAGASHAGYEHNHAAHEHHHVGGGCPGAAMRTFNREAAPAGTAASGMSTVGATAAPPATATPAASTAPAFTESQLVNWPVQIKLAPTNAPYFNGANLLIAADCCAYAYANFHADFIKNKVCLIGCPKLDDTDYSEKLTEIISNNDIKSVHILRMEVPCCGGLEAMAKKALQGSGKFIPWQVTTISLDGNILD